MSSLSPVFPGPHAPNHLPGGVDDLFLANGNYLDNAVETGPRHQFNGSNSLSNTTVYLSYFTSYRTLTVSQMLLTCGGTAGAGMTHVQWGLYTVAANGDLTLVARIADVTDASVLVATNTEYVKPFDTGGGFPATYQLVRGTRYAVGLVFAGATTAPRPLGVFGPGATHARAPRTTASYATGSPTTLPTSITSGSLATTGNFNYAALLV